ncbi:piggyBac transposable element-derived protein 4-like [Melanaphis sacchari]|uniref:piggyBac transposable element-derived protein 4-like n=1 Tax=Melanaphis sacchari TaxID=742174 RepID=UPI000DC14ECA|nr:piggyBac transposable element-derived protein 4-like [Melanaphis sacchari]
MSAHMNENNIVECLFEDLPSDSDSFTSYDDSDADETYLPNKDVEVVEDNNFSDDLMDQNDDELVEILNLDEDTNEIMTFLGMNILMGIKRNPSYRDYWSTALDLHDDYISSLMTVNRFGWLLSSLHLNDNSVMTKRGETVDESMIKFKGRSTLKQYMPNKPIKRGYKVWSLADKHGYLWNFDLYTGKRGDSVETNLGGRVVKDLTNPLQHKNHNVYIDNFFTSVPLLAYLKSKGIFCCGTVKSTRKYLPKLESDKNMTMGDIDWNMSDKYDISIVKWKDKRGVTLLSNFHNPTDVVEVKRKSKDGTTSMIPCPSKSSGSPSPLLVKRASVSPSVRKDQSAHQPDRTTRRRCAHCSTKEKEVRTDWKCTICDVPLSKKE